MPISLFILTDSISIELPFLYFYILSNEILANDSAIKPSTDFIV